MPPARLGSRFMAWFIDATICFVPAAITYFVLVYFTFKYTWYFDGASFFQVVGKGTDLVATRSEQHTSELQSRGHLVCRLLLEKKNDKHTGHIQDDAEAQYTQRQT